MNREPRVLVVPPEHDLEVDLGRALRQAVRVPELAPEEGRVGDELERHVERAAREVPREQRVAVGHAAVALGRGHVDRVAAPPAGVGVVAEVQKVGARDDEPLEALARPRELREPVGELPAQREQDPRRAAVPRRRDAAEELVRAAEPGRHPREPRAVRDAVPRRERLERVAPIVALRDGPHVRDLARGELRAEARELVVPGAADQQRDFDVAARPAQAVDDVIAEAAPRDRPAAQRSDHDDQRARARLRRSRDDQDHPSQDVEASHDGSTRARIMSTWESSGEVSFP